MTECWEIPISSLEIGALYIWNSMWEVPVYKFFDNHFSAQNINFSRGYFIFLGMAYEFSSNFDGIYWLKILWKDCVGVVEVDRRNLNLVKEH